MIVEQETTLIRKLRVTSVDRDRAALYQKFSLALSSANLQPAGLPASYIVCIRRLRTSLPRLSEGQFPTAEWSRAVGTSIAEIAGAGVRPARGIVPDSARAVIFTDKAELIECLARDWCDDRLRAHWWWRSLFGKLPTGEDVIEFCKTSPQYFPAALQDLSSQGKAVGFVRRFSNGEAQELLRSITRSFALPALHSLLTRRSHHDLDSSAQSNFSGRPPGVAIQRPNETPSHPPWKSYVPDTDADGLTTGQQLLLGVSLMLQRSPATVRTRDFGRQVESWVRAKRRSDAMGLMAHATVEGKAQGHRQEGVLPPEGEAGGNTYVSQGPTALLNNLASSPDRFSPESTPTVSGRLTADATVEKAPALSSDWSVDGSARNTRTSGTEEIGTTSSLAIEPIPLSHDALSVSHRKIEGDALESRIALQPATVRPDHLSAIEAQMETQFGGLFYLINLALYLDLYGDFTVPTHLDIPLNIWDFVALTGRALIGDRIKKDPVWQLLALLAARAENTEPGCGFEPEDEWRMPAEWLKPFATDGPCGWTRTGGRLRLFHPDQFVVFDVPLKPGNVPGDSEQQLQREIKAYQDFELQVSRLELAEDPGFQLTQDSQGRQETGSRSLKSGTVSRLQLWLSRVMPYVRVRLRTALALKAAEDLGSAFERQPARVVVTATHLEVFLALADLPIAIRFAGLDRNPGWVPAAGRFIAFHFD